MFSKEDYTDTIYSDEIGQYINGFVSKETVDTFKSASYEVLIHIGLEFRPDKVAAFYLGDPNYSWMIDMVNDFTNGVEEYYLGRKILIPNLDLLSQQG